MNDLEFCWQPCQFEFMDTNNVLKEDLNKVWFDLKKQMEIQKVIVLILKKIQKENITLNENTSCCGVSLPFKEYRETLSDNYFNCKKRFSSLSERFDGNSELLQEHNNIIKEKLKLNVVEKYHHQKLITLIKSEIFITYHTGRQSRMIVLHLKCVLCLTPVQKSRNLQ